MYTLLKPLISEKPAFTQNKFNYTLIIQNQPQLSSCNKIFNYLVKFEIINSSSIREW